MKLLLAYIRKQRQVLAFFLLLLLICWGFSALNDVPVSTMEYGAVLVCFFGGIFFCIGLYQFTRKIHQLEQMARDLPLSLEKLPEPADLLEEQYQICLRLMKEEEQKMTSDQDRSRTDMLNYYTLWAHQIKTPIAAMKLILQGIPDKGSEITEIENELFSIQQYVDMVLSYLRMGSTTNDFVLGRVSLEKVVKDSIHKYARQFIRRKLYLNYHEFQEIVLTDEKWLSFVVEQILSNALKYTRQGGVTIYLEEPKTLVIEDTGIGIAPEDLPRIFEKGYTGYNGRSDRKSTGIGLYLCRTILNKLGHEIDMTSQIGKGTRVCIRLDTVELGVE